MDLIAEIKKKKELAGLPDSVIQPILDKVKRRNSFPGILTKSQRRTLIKQTRSELRSLVGRFTLRAGSSENLLEQHPSTRERLPYYEQLKSKIKELHPQVILDLGSGTNPLALAHKGITYYAYDLDGNVLEHVKTFFSKEKLSGKAIVADIRTETFPHADLALLFKVLDLVDTKGHKVAESILKRISAQHLIISFSTKTLSGKPMNHPQRGWIEKLLTRLGYSWELWKTPNELYYFAKLIQ